MRRLKGFSKGWVIAGIAAVVLLGVLTYLVIDKKNKATDYTQYDTSSSQTAEEANGEIGDHIKGDENAPVKIVEYTNYQCNHCADINPIVEQIVNDSEGKVAIISRNLTMSSFQNSKAAAAAAEAAGLQGYWHEYSNLLFENQAEWAGATSSERTALFEQYLQKVSGNKADMDKFREDVSSDVVDRKIKFDSGLAKEDGVDATPYFMYNKQHLKLDEGGELDVDGKVVKYEKVADFSELSKIINAIVAAKTGQQ